MVGTDPAGPFTTEPERVMPPASGEIQYTGKLHLLGDQLVYLATALRNEDGAFVGDLTDSQPVTIGQDGRLSIEAQSPTNPTSDSRMTDSLLAPRSMGAGRSGHGRDPLVTDA